METSEANSRVPFSDCEICDREMKDLVELAVKLFANTKETKTKKKKYWNRVKLKMIAMLWMMMTIVVDNDNS